MPAVFAPSRSDAPAPAMRATARISPGSRPLRAVDAAMDSQPPRDFAQGGPVFLQYPPGFAVGCGKLLMRRGPKVGVIENLVAPAVVADV